VTVGNTAIGFESLAGGINPALNTGNYNTAVGYQALHVLTSGAYNTAVGSFAGNLLTTGGGNTLIGSGSGESITTGNYNTIIGTYAGTTALTSTVVLSDGLGNVQLYATGSRVAFGKTATPNATVDITGSAIITGSLTVTGNIVNILGSGFVSCSLSVSGSTASQRAFIAEFKNVDGSALNNPRQLIHWWTSATQYGAASVPATAAATTYTTVSGSQVVANTTGSINHAVTNTSGVFAVRLATTSDAGSVTVWFHTEVQGIIYSTSTTLFNVST
jgi:hypothetical protein